MSKNISENIKEEVLKTYMYTKRPLRSIAKEYNILYEDVITILEEYKSIYGEITRSLKKTEDVYSLEEKIYQLKEEGLSYQEIQRRVNINIKTIREICKKIYDSKGKKVPKAKKAKAYKKKRVSKLRQYKEEIYILREQGLSYRSIVNELENQGIKISLCSVRNICKEIYSSRGEIEPNLNKKKNQLEDELIYSLREQGFTHREIEKIMEEKNIKVSYETIRKKCKKIYESKGENEADLRIKELDIEKIYMLRKQGLSYIEITEEFKSEGIEIDVATIRKRCKEIYTLKEETVPKARKIIDVNNEENKRIYELRNKGLGYVKISKELALSGINLSVMTIKKRCKKLYDLKGEIEPQVVIKDYTRHNELIYSLREEGLSYQSIVKELENQGIKITCYAVRRICKEIYLLNGKNEPILKSRKKNKVIPEELNQKIYELREQGLNYREISDKLKEQGINLNQQSVGKRHKKFLKLSEQELAKAILNLTITRKATMKQIQQIADYYGVDLEKTMNSLEEPTHSLDER